MTTGVMICSFTDDVTYRIVVEGREWRFDYGAMFGPLFVSARGRDLKNQPKHVSLLRAVTLWARQGKRVDAGQCVWDEPPPLRVEHLGGKHYKLLPGQEPGVDYDFSRHVVVEP